MTPTPAICDALNASALVAQYVPGGVWWGMADQETASPYVIVTLVDAPNVGPCQGARVGNLEPLYRVLAYAPLKTTPVEALVDAATAVHNALMALPLGTVFDGWQLRRVRWQRLEERAIPESGEFRLQAVGGQYQLSLVEGVDDEGES